MDWIISNIANILIVLILVSVVVLIIRRLVKDRKNGKCSCGNACSSCAMAGNCHKAAEKANKKLKHVGI